MRDATLTDILGAWNAVLWFVESCTARASSSTNEWMSSTARSRSQWRYGKQQRARVPTLAWVSKTQLFKP